MKKPAFANNQIYHIYNRGVEKRDVFMDDADRFRFIHNLFEFNDTSPAQNTYYKQLYEVEPRKVSIRRDLLVEILAYCLMPNHYHLLLKQCKENGIVNFMQKLGTGYTMSFNQKYDRVGSLFQGRYKAVVIDDHRHFLFMPHYIHLNPLDLIMPSWKEKQIANTSKALEFLENYRWSSYQDYAGKKNFPSVISKKSFQELYGSPSEYKKSLETWLSELDIDELKNIGLDS